MINLVGGPAVCYSCSGRSALLPPLCHGDSRGTCGRRVLSRCPKPSAAFRSPGRGGFYLLYHAPGWRSIMIYNICHFLHQYAGNGGGTAYAPHGVALGRAAGCCYAVPDGFVIFVCLEEPSQIFDFPRDLRYNNVENPERGQGHFSSSKFSFLPAETLFFRYREEVGVSA